MDALEKMKKIEAFQQQIRNAQLALKESYLSDGGELQVTMNGSIQITDIKWLLPVNNEQLQTEILIKTINQAILNINVSLKKTMAQITQAMNLPNVGV